MDTESKQQYMNTMLTSYNAATKKEKGFLLDEYCVRTHESRKHAIKKFRGKIHVKMPQERKKRGAIYDGRVCAALAHVWSIFDYPCGQRFYPLLDAEIDRLRRLGELLCTETIAEKLKTISPASIDRLLLHERIVRALHLKYAKKRDLSLLSHVPTKTSTELNRTKPGSVQVDCVEHCGASAAGEYANTLATVDILFGWWEAEVFLGKGQRPTLAAIDVIRMRSPIAWVEMHPDNGSNFLNWHMVAYAEENALILSRSRPYKKNDNCFIEQKNSTHVRREFGYLRFDTKEEIAIIQDLYRNELRLYKNFFQPVMKIVEKFRVKGKIHRRYDTPKTPYQRILASPDISDEIKVKLTQIYNQLNPAELKRTIDHKIKLLHRIYCAKSARTTVGQTRTISITAMSHHLMHA